MLDNKNITDEDEWALGHIKQVVMQFDPEVDVDGLRQCICRHWNSLLCAVLLDEIKYLEKFRTPQKVYRLIIHLGDRREEDWMGCRIEQDGELLQAYKIWSVLPRTMAGASAWWKKS